MKTFKKVLASTLAAAMVVTALPVTPANAAAAPKLSAKKATVYVGQSKTIKVTTPKAWKSVKVKATTSKKSVATVKTSKKKITVKAVKAGTAKVTVKVTAKKAKKTVKKTLKATITVKNPTLSVSAADVVAVNATEAIKTTVKPANATVSYKSSDETVATVDAKGVVTGVKAGEATITVSAKSGKKTVSKDVKMTVKTVILKSATQKKAAQIEATFVGDTSKLDKKDIIITNTSNNVVYPVKAISVAADKTTVTIDTFSDMNDAKEYSVKYDGAEAKFTATDGTVADVGVDKTTIVKGSNGSVVKAQFLDKNNIVVKEFTLTDAASEGSIDYSFTENKGYTDGDKLVLLNTGDTATAEVTYHTLKYDQTTGAETGKITKKITVTAVEDDSTLSDFNYTINDKATLVNWNNEVKTNNKIAYGDKAYAFVYIKNSNGDDVTSQYKVESSDNSVLLLAKQDLKTAGDFKGSTGVEITGVKAGTAYINVLNADGKIVKSLPVVVQDVRKLTTVKCDDLTVANTSGVNNEDSAKFEAYDQYEKKTDISSINTTIVSAPDKDTTNTKGKSANFVTLDGKDKYHVDASSLKEGTYSVKIEASTDDDNCDKNVKVSRVVNIKVVSVDTAKDTASFKLNVSSQKTDLAVAYGTSESDILDKKVTATVDKYIKGAKVEAGVNADITIKNPDGTKVGTNEVKFYTTTTNGAITFANNIKTGTYKVEATIAKTSTTAEKTFSTTFTVENTQSKAIAKIDKKNQSGSTAEDILASVLEYSYEGVKQDLKIVSVDSKANGNAIYIKSAKVNVKINDNGDLLTVDCDINTSFTK